ncbi:MAG: CHAD domain-containing protein [Cyanobacteria bacterium P01_H01_bin.105]
MKPQPLSEVSPLLVSRPPDRLGDYAHQAIQTCVGHILKQEKGVLAQRDPEFVHQMRVGLRRLRTVVQVFDVAIALPKALKDRALKQLGNVLGRVRDLDVLQNWLSNYTDQANLKKSEKKILRTLTNRLKKHRKKRVAQMQKYLQSNTYKRLTKTWQRWLKHPHYKKLACLPLDISLSDLQLPIIAQLLLHPGWLVTDSTDPTNLEHVHALRKLIKGIRYQMALFRNED